MEPNTDMRHQQDGCVPATPIVFKLGTPNIGSKK